MSDRIKVVGYAKREFFGNGIEYRNFSPDLVGLQITSEGGTPLFTMGNFNITTNMDAKSDKIFITNRFSNFITLTDLDLTLSNANQLLTDNAGVLLNLDRNNLKYNAQFGSLNEFVRVSLENIITTWPASLYLNNKALNVTGNVVLGNTFENYQYDSLTDSSTFRVDTTFINNSYELNYLTNGNILNTFSSGNDLRNLTVSYSVYSVLVNDNEYDLVEFTGATDTTNDYIYIKVKGDPFSGISSSNFSYHIKPNKVKEETFFNTLPYFEAYLLNRLITPKYTATFKYSVKSDEGSILYLTDSVTWPTTDGYNIDFDTTDYVDYATKLLDISTNNDLSTSDLMNRVLVSDSISSFDTAPVNLSYLDQDSTGQKVTKTLRVYGRNFDEINNFIDGIAFANTVSYDKQDNIPDIYIKNLARVLGWELVSSVIENGLLSSYVTTSTPTYEGQTVGLTAVEADVELWRRIILNSPWLWKSKGARKSIEFLLRFIGVPLGLVTFNEHIYKADAPIDMDLFKAALELNGLDTTDLSIYPIDSDGYPSPMLDTPTMYFQNYGLWYRETGGVNSTHDILNGNNPHLGPYDGGYAYINQFTGLIPNFSAVTITSETITTGSTRLFTNYNIGEITNYSGNTYVDAEFDDGSDISKCMIVVSEVIPDPNPQSTTNECGCSPESADDALSICVKMKDIEGQSLCDKMISPPIVNDLGYYTFNYGVYGVDGEIINDINGNQSVRTSIYGTKECCKANNGIPTIYSTTIGLTTPDVVINTGYVCCVTNNCGCNVACKWTPIYEPKLLPLNSSNQDAYMEFIKPDGSLGVTTPDGSHCVVGPFLFTTPTPNVLDPYTGEIGYGCKLTQNGLNDLAYGENSRIATFLRGKKSGNIPCCQSLLYII